MKGAKKTGAKRPRRKVLVPDPAGPGRRRIEVVVPSEDAECKPSDRAATAAEAAKQVKTLDENGRISRAPGKLGPGQTHAIETGRKGRRKLVRKRFSAV